jgi:PAS domain S-box-containing protein
VNPGEETAMANNGPAGPSWLTDLPLLSAAQQREVAAVFRRALVESPLPTVLARTGDGLILGCNRQFEQMLGFDEAVVHGQFVEDLVHPDDRERTSAVLGRLSRGETSQEKYEARWIRPDGRVVWTRRNILVVDGPAEDGRSYIVAVLEDLTQLRTAQQLASALIDIGGGIAAGASLDETAQRLTTLTQAGWADAGCVLTVLDPDRQVLVSICPNATTDRLLADLPEIPVGPSGGASGTAAWRDEPTVVTNLLEGTTVEPLQAVLARHGIVSSWAVPLHDPDGRVIGTLGVFHSYRYEPTPEDWAATTAAAGVAAIAVVAEQRRQYASREQQRMRTDPRTGLLNDVALTEHLDVMLARREPVTVAVATLRGPGRLASLESVARVALTTLAERAQALGQIPHVAASGVTSLAFVARAEWTEREARLLHRVLTRPMDIGTAVIRPEVSVGVAVGSATEPVTGAELLARATLAVPPRGGSTLVQPEPPDTARDHGLIADVAEAFRRGEFIAYYQPQFDLVTGAAVGSEALVRWNHPQRGVLTPAAFLPLIECIGASTELAFIMVRRAAADRLRRAEVGLHGNVAVNVTAENLLNESFLQVLRDPEDRLWRHISLELTEAQFVRAEAVTALEELAALGYAIALDDFGTGYSALSAIHTLPVSVVKIDQSFVARLPHDASAEALIAAISALCEQLGITVVAEGIESLTQARAVRDLGCSIGQGYLLSRPQPLEAFKPDMLRRTDIAAKSGRGASKPAIGEAARHKLLELDRQGASPTTIAAALNRSGYRAAGGTRWHPRSVRRVLDDEQPRPTP